MLHSHVSGWGDDLPVNDDAMGNIRSNLEKLASGDKAPFIEIGALTDMQFQAINAERLRRNLPAIESNA